MNLPPGTYWYTASFRRLRHASPCEIKSVSTTPPTAPRPAASTTSVVLDPELPGVLAEPIGFLAWPWICHF